MPFIARFVGHARAVLRYYHHAFPQRRSGLLKNKGQKVETLNTYFRDVICIIGDSRS